MFPTPYPVIHTACTGVTQDAMGNDVPEYNSEPVTRKVYGWSEHRSETTNGERSGSHEREIADLDMSLPASIPVGQLDLFHINNGQPYVVVGIRDRNNGFHRWRPGRVLELRRVPG
jgi:hypothetical protein